MSDAGHFLPRVSALTRHQRVRQSATEGQVPGTYLVIIRETRLAHAVAMELQARLAVCGHRSRALVPPLRGRDFTALAYRHLAGQWADEHLSSGERPVLVAMCEQGLAEDLERLGLSAYVAVPPGRETEESGGPHSIVVPAATARTFVAAVIDHVVPPALPKRENERSAVARWGYRPALAAARSNWSVRLTAVGAAGIAGTLVVGGMAPSDLQSHGVSLVAYQQAAPEQAQLARGLLPAVPPLPPGDPYEIGRNVGINLLGDAVGIAAYSYAVRRWPDNKAKQIAFSFLAGNVAGLAGWASGPFLQEAAQGHLAKAMELVSHQFQQMAQDVNQFSLNQLGEYLTNLGFNPAIGHFWTATIVGNALGIPAGVAGQMIYDKLEKQLNNRKAIEERGKATRALLQALKVASPTAFENLVSYATRSEASHIPTTAAAAALAFLISNLTWKMLPPAVQKDMRNSVSKTVGTYWLTHPFVPNTPRHLGSTFVGLPPAAKHVKGTGPLTGLGSLKWPGIRKWLGLPTGSLEGGRLIAPNTPGLQQARADLPGSDLASLFQPGVRPQQPFGLPEGAPAAPSEVGTAQDNSGIKLGGLTVPSSISGLTTPAVPGTNSAMPGDQPALSSQVAAPPGSDPGVLPDSGNVNSQVAAPPSLDPGVFPDSGSVNSQVAAPPSSDPGVSSDTGNINDQATTPPVQLPPTLPALDTSPASPAAESSLPDQAGSEIERAWTSVSGNVGDFLQNDVPDWFHNSFELPTPAELPWEGPPSQMLTSVLDESYSTPLSDEAAPAPDQGASQDSGNVSDEAAPAPDQGASQDSGNVSDEVAPAPDQGASQDSGNVSDEAVPAPDQGASQDSGNVNDEAATPDNSGDSGP